ncbi:MAG: hypothetical protein ACNA8W_04245 [Bradymonadaceae bacterium]
MLTIALLAQSQVCLPGSEDGSTRHCVPGSFIARGLEEALGREIETQQDGEILLLPVRCLETSHRLVSTPQVLKRFAEVACMLELVESTDAMKCDMGQALSVNSSTSFFLEELQFDRIGSLDSCVVRVLAAFIARSPGAARRLEERLTIVSEEDFNWLLEHSLPTQCRGEECLPADTLIYTRQPSSLEEALAREVFLQVGANKTTGQGWFQVVGCL